MVVVSRDVRHVGWIVKVKSEEEAFGLGVFGIIELVLDALQDVRVRCKSVPFVSQDRMVVVLGFRRGVAFG